MKLSTFTIASAFYATCSSGQQTSEGAVNGTQSTHDAIQAATFCEGVYGPHPQLNRWYYQSWANGPYGPCNRVDDTKQWSMLSAYRTGGLENVHWKYTSDVNYPACLTKWGYYTADGQTLRSIVERTTTEGGARWCALPVYLQGGVQGKQWGYCKCSSNLGGDP